MACGGWTRVPDFEHSIEIDDYSRFAVDEYNKKQKRPIYFRRVVDAWQQVVAGMNYRLTLECDDGYWIRYYEGTVWVKPWENFKCLVDFKPVPAIKGQWIDVKNFQSSAEIDDYSRFAVDEYSKQQKRLIIFRRVVAGQQQEVVGVNYRLIIECEDANRIKLYEAIVYVKEMFKRLEEFKPLELYNKQQVIDALKTTAETKVEGQRVQMQPLVGY